MSVSAIKEPNSRDGNRNTASVVEVARLVCVGKFRIHLAARAGYLRNKCAGDARVTMLARNTVRIRNFGNQAMPWAVMSSVIDSCVFISRYGIVSFRNNWHEGTMVRVGAVHQLIRW